MTERAHADLAEMSDDQLRVLEEDRSLPMDRWLAVEAERGRRVKSSSQAPPVPLQGHADSAPSSAPSDTTERRLIDPEAEDGRVRAALVQLQALLVPGERLLAYAVQRRLFALTHRRTIAAATSGRFVVLSRALFAGYGLYDVRWQDLRDANVQAGIFGATISIASLATEDFASNDHASGHPGVRAIFVGLRKSAAERVYAICQAQEQVWREKRRLRAQAGGVQIGGAVNPGGAPSTATADPLERLRRAKEMMENGLISDTEYESIKARVVDGL